MTRFCVFTPTRLPGIDVTFFSVARQTLGEGDELMWIVADEIDRDLPVPNNVNEMASIKVPWDPGNTRNLARAYNYGLRMAREWDADIFVSLQDYIWAPEHGLKLFESVVQAAAERDEHKLLITGYCDISADPYPESIVDRENKATIFGVPFEGKPTDIAWQDARRTNFNTVGKDPGAIRQVSAVEWETNWAAIPKTALFDERLAFPEEFDSAVAYENQAYAFLAQQHDYVVVIDPRNAAISLPHKKYWPEYDTIEAPMTKINEQRTQEMFGV
jgi:hypothetical protein